VAAAGDALGLGLAAAAGLITGIGFLLLGVRPVDTDMVWTVGLAPHLYGAAWGAEIGSRYVYPPTLAQVVDLLRPIGWPAFLVAWQVLVFVALWVATRRWAPLVLAAGFLSAALWGWGSPLANPVTLAMVGNVQSLVAAAIVVGFARPAAWSFVLLTKIGPGIGVLWFVVRREWRQAGIAIGVTAAVTAISFVAAPSAWHDFLAFAVANANATPPLEFIAIPLLIRVPIACLVVAWAARTDRPWVVPLAVAWASLALYTWSWISISIAALPLWSASRDREVADRTAIPGPVVR
jgi:hypothetical protein